MAKLLLVDDDQDLSLIVSDKLFLEGHELDIAENAAQAETLLKAAEYDLLILDWDLPDKPGIEICRAYRDRGGITPVLMLTGRGTVDNKEEGFDAGADDYLTKPFEMKELASRVKALLRRASRSQPKQDGAASVTGAAVGPGYVIDAKYRLEEFIGQGGMAVIYRATHLSMGKTVVVKLIQAHLVQDDVTLRRFELECRAMASINHGNVVAAFDTGFVGGTQPYLVMEHVKGRSLADLIDTEGPLPCPLAVEIAIQICRGLEAAHSKGIIHRDLKPDNILLQDRNQNLNWVKLVDFGISQLIDTKERLTEANILMGSAGYVSPEHLRGVPLDERADIYALGIVLFEMLTRELPFKATNTEAFLVKQLLEAPEHLWTRRADISQDSAIDAIINRALAKNPDDRYQTAASLRSELECVLSASP